VDDRRIELLVLTASQTFLEAAAVLVGPLDRRQGVWLEWGAHEVSASSRLSTIGP